MRRFAVRGGLSTLCFAALVAALVSAGISSASTPA